MKVTEAQTILFIAGQVAYDDEGSPAHGRDFPAQAGAVFRSLQSPKMPANKQVTVSALGVRERLVEVEANAML